MLTFDKNLLNDVKLMVASQLERTLSWRDGMLIFKGEPLQSVVDEVSRYTRLKNNNTRAQRPGNESRGVVQSG